MDNGLSNYSSGDTPAPVKVPDFSRTKKENKFLKIFIPILILVILAGGVVATLFLTGVIGSKDNTPEDTIDVDIEDESMISKINDRLGVLFGKPVDNSEIVVNSSNYDDVSLWKALDLTEEQKINRILNTLDESQKIELDLTQKEFAATAWAENGGQKINLDSVIAYPGGIVTEKYKTVFGLNSNNIPLESQRVQYLTAYDIYLKAPTTETATNLERHYFIDRYFENGKNVYVYISGGLYNTDTRTSYCDVFTPDVTSVEACESVAEGQNFVLNKENNGRYLLRMLTFLHGKDGNLYFIGSDSPIAKYGIDPDAEE